MVGAISAPLTKQIAGLTETGNINTELCRIESIENIALVPCKCLYRALTHSVGEVTRIEYGILHSSDRVRYPFPSIYCFLGVIEKMQVGGPKAGTAQNPQQTGGGGVMKQRIGLGHCLTF